MDIVKTILISGGILTALIGAGCSFTEERGLGWTLMLGGTMLMFMSRYMVPT